MQRDCLLNLKVSNVHTEIEQMKDDQETPLSTMLLPSFASAVSISFASEPRQTRH